MSSDMIQNTYISREQEKIPARPAQAKRLFGRSNDAARLLRKSAPSGTAAPALQNKIVGGDVKNKAADTTALLKTAYKMLKRAEQDIASKEQRIKSLEEILTIDELTGLTNRRGFYRAFEGELDRTNRGENEGGLLIIVDLDYFKTINDSFGHLAGDEALKTAASFLSNATRPMDVVARLGGDEFIILMPNTSIAQAMNRARKIGNDLNDLTFEWKNSSVHIHASLGLKEYAQGDTIESIIEQADKGLYKDKEEKKPDPNTEKRVANR